MTETTREYDPDYVWDVEGGCTIDLTALCDSLCERIWDDFDEMDWVEDRYSKEDLWDAIVGGKDYDDFRDEMNDSICADASAQVHEAVCSYDSHGEFELDGERFYRLTMARVVF